MLFKPSLTKTTPQAPKNMNARMSIEFSKSFRLFAKKYVNYQQTAEEFLKNKIYLVQYTFISSKKYFSKEKVLNNRTYSNSDLPFSLMI